jgi:hypothetical protein
MATKKYTLEIDVESRTLGQLEKELQQVNEELKDVDRNSEAFQTLKQRSQELSRELRKVNLEIEGWTLEKKIETADGAIKVMTGTISGLVGAFAALGIESEVLDDIEKRTLGVIALGVGVKDISEGVGKLAKNIDLAAVAQKAFNVATLSNPYIIAGAAIAAAIGPVENPPTAAPPSPKTPANKLVANIFSKIVLSPFGNNFFSFFCAISRFAICSSTPLN